MSSSEAAAGRLPSCCGIEGEGGVSDILTARAYGASVRVCDTTGEGFCRRVQALLAREFSFDGDPAEAAASYVISIGQPRRDGERSRYCVRRDAAEVFAVPTEDELLRLLSQEIDFSVARHSPDTLFVHAGVVAWRGLAIIVPGRSRSGKSTLVAALVRRGAVYYSDEFAVLDATGRVHPYRRPLALRRDGVESETLSIARDDVPREPLPLALILAGDYQPGAAWQPKVVRGALAALPLIDGAIVAREQPTRTLRLTARVSSSVVTLRGARGEASAVAGEVLDLIDDSLVSRALAAHDGVAGDTATDLQRVAERRLRARRRPAVPDRQLSAARFVRMTDFLSAADHARLLAHVLASRHEVVESGVIDQRGVGVLDHAFRRSQTVAGECLEGVWGLFEARLRALLAGVRRQLGMAWFPLGQIERQLVTHADGGFFAPHVDNGKPPVARRRITCVYYFHPTPRRYRGGELRLYDTWVTPTSCTPAATYSAIAPIDNSVVFFPSDALHEVCPVAADGAAFVDGRFAVTIWFWEGALPAALSALRCPPFVSLAAPWSG